MPLSRQNILAFGAAAVALTAVALAGANFFGEPGENGGVGPFFAMLAVSIAVAAAVFGWAIPRTERPARAGLVTGALALLSLPVFWTGLPYVLGPAAIAYGLIGRARAEEGRAAATVAVALGTLATVAAVAVVIVDQTT